MWHAALECVQYGPVPVIAALHGAVVGGGLELASACHIRVADDITFYALPEGSRGIFVGGGGAVRIPRLIGAARMTDMMLTGRVYNAEDGERVGFAQYLVPQGTAFDKAMELAQRVAQNAPLTNYALMHALPRIAEQPADQGFLTEALMAAIAQSAPEAKEPRARLPRRPRHQGHEGMSAAHEHRDRTAAPASLPARLRLRRHARACCAKARPACATCRPSSRWTTYARAHHRPAGALGRGRARAHLHGAPRCATPTAAPATGAT